MLEELNSWFPEYYFDGICRIYIFSWTLFGFQETKRERTWGVGEDIQRLKSPENLDFPPKKIRSITLAKIID